MNNTDSSQLISYANYIEQALYNENNGYYMVDREKISKMGDFYTTPMLSTVFSEVIADYFRQLVYSADISPVFYEIGSGTGIFAKSFLSYLKKVDNNLYEKMNYISIEKSEYHIRIQKNSIHSNRIKFYSDLKEFKNFNGFIFSNEWFDVLPVYIIEKSDHKIYEVMLKYVDNVYYEVKIPLKNPHIISYLKQFPQLEIKNGQRIEIPYFMLEFYKELVEKLVGFIVTVDYGYTFSELQNPYLSLGTLRGYKNHQLIKDILNVPDVDITYHVHFDAMIETGEISGCKTVDFLRQDEFLLKHGILNKLVKHTESDPFSVANKYNRAIRTLLDPTGISSAFHVLVQRK